MVRKVEADLRHPSPGVIQGLAQALRIPDNDLQTFQDYARTGWSRNPAIGRVDIAATITTLRTTTNLPIPPTPLIDRVHESHLIHTLIQDAGVRLVTLTGPGGVGKTRLALAIALALLDQFRHGTFFVALAPLTDPDLVLPTIARTLQIAEQGMDSLLATLQRELKHRQILLVLDNFEHVSAASVMIADLLREAPQLTLLITSRESLHIQAEHEVVVPPLPIPDLAHPTTLQTLSHYDAVRLFIERARAVRASFDVTNADAPAIAEICARLDGLPLAIELAAAWIKVLSPDALLRRLDMRLTLLHGGSHDLPDRHQTLRATIDWSYALLTAAQRQILRHLAVFVGSCSLDAIEAVVGGVTHDEQENYSGAPQYDHSSAAAFETLGLLHALVDKSLVYVEDGSLDGTRFRMLETIREYAFERLVDAGEADLYQWRHAAFFLDFAESAAPQLLGNRQELWLRHIDDELPNLRAALRWTIAHGDTERALRIGTALARFWWMRGHLREGRDWLEQILDHCGACQPSSRAHALYWIGVLALYQDDYGPALRALEESLSIAEELGNRRSIGFALNALALAANRQGHPRSACTLYEQALTIYRELNDQERIATTLNNLGFTMLLIGDEQRAEVLLTESLDLAHAQEDWNGIAFAVSNLGMLALRRDDLDHAAAALAESLAVFWSLGNKQSCAECLEGLAAIAHKHQHSETAASALGAADALRGQIGAPVPHYLRDAHCTLVEAVRYEAGNTLFLRAFTTGATCPETVVGEYATRTATSGQLPLTERAHVSVKEERT